jgi:hypothetical protein
MTSNYETTKAWRALNKDKVNEQARRYRAKHRDQVRAIARRWRANHLAEVRAQDAEVARRRRANNPEVARKAQIKWRERREVKLAELAGGRRRPDSCDLCEATGLTVFDHNHDNGAFRGWLCDRCNKVLGLVRDNQTLLMRMALYLEETRGQTDHQSTQISG